MEFILGVRITSRYGSMASRACRLRKAPSALLSLSHFTACCSPSFLAISRAVFLSRSIIERNSAGAMY